MRVCHSGTVHLGGGGVGVEDWIIPQFLISGGLLFSNATFISRLFLFHKLYSTHDTSHMTGLDSLSLSRYAPGPAPLLGPAALLPPAVLEYGCLFCPGALVWSLRYPHPFIVIYQGIKITWVINEASGNKSSLKYIKALLLKTFLLKIKNNLFTNLFTILTLFYTFIISIT